MNYDWYPGKTMRQSTSQPISFPSYSGQSWLGQQTWDSNATCYRLSYKRSPYIQDGVQTRRDKEVRTGAIISYQPLFGYLGGCFLKKMSLFPVAYDTLSLQSFKISARARNTWHLGAHLALLTSPSFSSWARRPCSSTSQYISLNPKPLKKHVFT